MRSLCHGSALLALAVASGCSCGQTTNDVEDADLEDTAQDGGPAACEPANGGMIELVGERLVSSAARAGVVLLRALVARDGNLRVLYFLPEVPDFGGGTRRLVSVSPDWRVLWNTEISSVVPTWSATADFAESPDGWEVFRIEWDSGSQTQLWRTVVDDTGGLVSDVLLETIEDPVGSVLEGMAVLRNEGGSPDVYLLRAGDLFLRRSGTETAMGAHFERFSRLVGTRSIDEATTCLVVREREKGNLVLLRLSSVDIVAERAEVLAGGASFNPLPLAGDGTCTLAYYEPDPAHPTGGHVALYPRAAEVVGWRGTAPLGLSLLDDGRMAIAARDPDWPGQTDLWWLQIHEGTCATPTPALTLPGAQRGVPLGDILALDTAAGPRFVLGGLSGSGEVAFAAPVVE